MSACSSSSPIPIRLDYGYWNRPCRNTPPCGDAAGLIRGKAKSWLLVMDAIGHGPVAHRVSRLSLDLFKTILSSSERARLSIDDLVLHLHQGLASRNLDEQAAINVYRFDHQTARLEAIMIGNLESFLISPSETRVLTNQNGMVGGRLPQSLHRQTFDLRDNHILAVLSDGINLVNGTRDIGKYVYGPFSNRPLEETARLLVNGYHRDYDDASCALVRVSLDRP